MIPARSPGSDPASHRPRRLVLFDIDGTLLSCGRQVRTLFGTAFTAVFGIAGGFDGYDFAGKTDRRIVHDLATAGGVPVDDALAALPRVRERYLANLRRGLDHRQMRVMPGARELLARLAGRGDVALGLLTGNFEEGAYCKLGRVGLDRFFGFGAFGDDGLDRDELPPVSLARAATAFGRRFGPADTLVVGDTPLDVACARAHGLPVLAVATGTVPAERLAAAGADWVAPDLTAAAALIDWLDGDG
jgi:phosphoglycolate phosphatase-like HAD superfamily hydrolase